MGEGEGEGGCGSTAVERLQSSFFPRVSIEFSFSCQSCFNGIFCSSGMSDLSCDRQVVLNDPLPDGTLELLYVYTGAAPRVSNAYQGAAFSGDPPRDVPEEDRGERGGG